MSWYWYDTFLHTSISYPPVYLYILFLLVADGCWLSDVIVMASSPSLDHVDHTTWEEDETWERRLAVVGAAASMAQGGRSLQARMVRV